MQELSIYECLDKPRLSRLKDEAANDERKRARILLHRDARDPVQQMLIAVGCDSYIRPHRQIGKRKSYVFVEGRLFVVFFDAEGEMLERVVMDDSGKGQRIISFDAGTWHTVVNASEVALYVETISGPYKIEGTEWAPWAPDPVDTPNVRRFLRMVSA